ncbi:MAG: hypothetical protein PQJ61_04590 [Spirochaetales bacterium]|uniref:Cache domain-containing protein n=1 Tax=Candidatus Thalassospirochaeta sargassi TaxID=3119039 RepID=A0AAJ1MLT8_9SPIO|nr:hypothetical protein [Spirochaetales bacterium]
MSNLKPAYWILPIVIIAAFGFLLILDAINEIAGIKNYTRDTEMPLLGTAAAAIFDNIAMMYEKAGFQLLEDGYIVNWILNGEQDPDELSSYMKKVRDANDLLDASLISDVTEMYYGTDGRVLQLSPLNRERDGWYYHYRENSQDINIDSWYYPETDLLGLFINIPVFDSSGRYIGVTGGGVDASVFNKTFRALENDWDVRLYLVRPDGQLIYAENKEIMSGGAVSVDDLWSYPVIDTLVRMKNSPKGVVVSPDTDENLLWGEYLEIWDSYLIIERSGGILRQNVSSVLRRTIVIEILLIFLMLSFILVVLKITYGKAGESIAGSRVIVQYLQALIYILDRLVGTALTASGDEKIRIQQCRESVKSFLATDGDSRMHNMFNLNDIINDLVIEKASAFSRNGISIISRLRSVPLIVSGDEALFMFVLNDVLAYAGENAVRGSEIVLVSGKSPELVFIEAVFQSRDRIAEPELSVIEPVLQQFDLSVELKTSHSGNCILRLEVYSSGE